MIAFECSHCGKKLQVRDEFAGQTGKCPSCAATMDIPTQDGSAALAYQVVADEEPEAIEPEAPPPSVRPRRRSDREEEEWQPPAEVCNHAGGPLSGKEDFFAAPPPEIGEVFSASSSLRRDAAPMAPTTRLTVAIAIGAGGLVLGVVIALSVRDSFLQLLFPVLFSGLGVGITLLATRFRHTCTFVGSEGIARFRCAGSREQVDGGDVFCFRDASELRSAQTRHYTNGVYQNTTYSYTWSDVTGRKRYQLSGSFRSEQGNPSAKSPFHFAFAAERAWTLYLYGQVQAQLKTSGTIYFGLGGRNWVRLGEEYISLHFNGETTECRADDIAQVRIEQGMVQVRRKDAREGWFSSQGVFKFPYGNLGNAQLFQILMEKLVGVPING